MTLRAISIVSFLFPAALIASSGSPGSSGDVRFAPPWSSAFHVDAAHPYSLVNAEGRHLYLMNHTAWLYFQARDPIGVLKRIKNTGATTMRVALEGTPYFDVKHIDLWPWGGTRQKPDYQTFAGAYWDEVERRVRLAGEQGIGIDLVFYFTLKPSVAEFETQKPYFAEAIRRLSKYANILTWEIANEYIGNEAFQDAAGEYLHANDPWHHPVCTSDGTTDNAVWPQKSWMDLALVHTCTSSTAVHDLADWYLAVARNTRSWGKPAFDNETGRERRHKNDDPVNRRKQSWLWGAAGAYWTWHSFDGCEGIDDLGYHAPGEEFLLPFAACFSALPFWQMAPTETAVQSASSGIILAVLGTPEDTDLLAYFCVRETGRQMSGVQAKLRLSDGTFRIDFLEPSTGRVLSSQFYESHGIGGQGAITLPAFRDDLALHIVMVKAAQRSWIQGTR